MKLSLVALVLVACSPVPPAVDAGMDAGAMDSGQPDAMDTAVAETAPDVPGPSATCDQFTDDAGMQYAMTVCIDAPYGPMVLAVNELTCDQSAGTYLVCHGLSLIGPDRVPRTIRLGMNISPALSGISGNTSGTGTMPAIRITPGAGTNDEIWGFVQNQLDTDVVVLNGTGMPMPSTSRDLRATATVRNRVTMYWTSPARAILRSLPLHLWVGQ